MQICHCSSASMQDCPTRGPGYGLDAEAISNVRVGFPLPKTAKVETCCRVGQLINHKSLLLAAPAVVSKQQPNILRRTVNAIATRGSFGSHRQACLEDQKPSRMGWLYFNMCMILRKLANLDIDFGPCISPSRQSLGRICGCFLLHGLSFGPVASSLLMTCRCPVRTSKCTRRIQDQ